MRKSGPTLLEAREEGVRAIEEAEEVGKGAERAVVLVVHLTHEPESEMRGGDGSGRAGGEDPSPLSLSLLCPNLSEAGSAEAVLHLAPRLEPVLRVSDAGHSLITARCKIHERATPSSSGVSEQRSADREFRQRERESWTLPESARVESTCSDSDGE